MKDNKIAFDLTDTQIAFSSRSNKELKETAFLFKMMNKPAFVKLGSQLGLAALKLHVPFTTTIIKKTIYKQFCGGTDINECQPVIDKLYKDKIWSILDYGLEGKDGEEAFDHVVDQTKKSIDFAAENASVPVLSLKISGIANNKLLQDAQEKDTLSDKDQMAWNNVYRRLDEICAHAHNKSVGLFIDAEESWIQISIDHLVKKMMEKYNKKRSIVYNTYQMYRHDKLSQLKEDYEEAHANNYILAAKIVRGAYMEKERSRAQLKGYVSPIQTNKIDTDNDYNNAIRYCVDHYEDLALCNATHNIESCKLLADLIAEKGIAKDHHHLNFCQLYGMSDYITYNLANAGYNVAKYLPYGPVKEVIPYLIRRAQENASVTGEMSRELKMIVEEMDRRKK